MDGVMLLAEARAAGLTVRGDGGHLVVRGPKSAEPLALSLLERKADVLRILTAEAANLTDVSKSPADGDDAEVAWRVAAMRPRVPPEGHILFLVARPDVPPRDGCCLSCGALLGEGGTVRCAWCSRAAERAIGEVREGLAP